MKWHHHTHRDLWLALMSGGVLLGSVLLRRRLHPSCAPCHSIPSPRTHRAAVGSRASGLGTVGCADMSPLNLPSSGFTKNITQNQILLGRESVHPLMISCQGGKSSCKWESAKEGVRISCYQEDLYPLNPMIDTDLIFTAPDFSEIPMELLRLKISCVCVPVWQLDS